MAELLGLVASVLQLVDVAVQARNYVKDFSSAPKDQQRLLLEIQNLETLLRELNKRIESNVEGAIGMQELKEPLIQLERTMKRLTRKLDPRGISKFSSRLAWPLWGKEDVQDGLSTIERFKSLLIAWMEMDIWDSAQEISGSIKRSARAQREYHDDIVSVITDEAEQQRIAHNDIFTLVGDVARNQERYYDSAHRDEIIQWYSPLNFFRRQADILSARQPGTGGWFLEDDIFKEWESGTCKTLWCRGIPGAGKTVLASIVIEHLRANLESESTGVAVIYLNHKENEMQSPPNILAAVWRQLIFRKPISPAVRTLYETHQEQRTRPSLEDAYAILSSTVKKLSRVFIVVDALDEYPEEQRDILVHFISRLGPTVNLMLMSRPHIGIVASTGVQTLEIRAAEEDIRRYIDAQIVKSSRLSKHVQNSFGLRGEIERTIVERSDGMFLVAKLSIDSLTTKHTVKAVRDALKNMPGDLNGTYDEVMQRINAQSEDDRNLARCTLLWISKTETALHISELREALAIEPDSSDLDPDNLLEMDIILSVCAGLVIVDEEELVRLIHYTAQDYLDRVQDRELLHAQTEITKACLTYLSFQKFTEPQDNAPETWIEENPLLEYAVLFCLVHARGEPELHIKPDILQFLTHLSVEWESLWGLMCDFHSSLPRTRLGIAAYFGMLHVATHLLEQDGFDIGALRGAAITGHANMVRLLMTSDGYCAYVERRKAPFEGHESIHRSNLESGTVLQEASFHGEEELVYSLLESGANVNAEAQRYGTALQAAAVNGHYAVVCILLANGADVNSQSALYGTALRAASLGGHMDIIFLLIQNGAEINARAGKHGTALAAALSCGHEDVARLLLEHGANVNDPGERGWTALGLAAGNGHQEIARLLIQKGANVNAKSRANNTALQAAASGGHNAIAILLIQKGANVNEQGGDHGTALQIASRLGREEMVHILLKNGAEVNARGGTHGTAVQAASSRGHDEIVHLLRQHGAIDDAGREA
ncbi:ankyrin repeat-containing domain protein [Mycena latifolia]|nr:ankyrin repeat-containing domain protein [Mycena latifolia]